MIGGRNMSALQRRIYNLIRDDDENDLASNIFDGFIIALIVINVAQVVLDTFDLSEQIAAASLYVEYFSIAVFTVEYALRVWCAPCMYPDARPALARLRYVFRFMSIVDLLAILPFYIPFIIPIDLRVLRSLRLLRLFRLFKVNRYTSALSTIGAVLKRKSSQLLSSVFVVALLMLISAVLMYNFENAAQPDVFTNAFDSLWWAVATFTTVGYGDIYPVTPAGRFLGAVIGLLGIGLVAVPTGIISAGFMEQIDDESKAGDDDKKYCPYCGHRLDE